MARISCIGLQGTYQYYFVTRIIIKFSDQNLIQELETLGWQEKWQGNKKIQQVRNRRNK